MRAEAVDRLSEILTRAGRCIAGAAGEAWAVVREELKTDSAAPADTPSLLTATDVAERLQTNVQTVYRLAREGKLPAVQTGQRAKRWTENSVNEFIRRGGVVVEPQPKTLRLLQGKG